eukprot:m.745620 g.745620  ORF g.745620 m.745620 type:complete len:50 (+) comp23127_c4_seq11:247-396(+)
MVTDTKEFRSLPLQYTLECKFGFAKDSVLFHATALTLHTYLRVYCSVSA